MATVERIRTELGDHYDPDTVELYPPRVDDPPPVPDRDEPMCSARSLLAAHGITVTPSNAPGRRRNWAPGIELVSQARWVVPLVLIAVALLVACVPVDDTEPVSHTPPAAPTTGPTPSPLGLSATEHGAAFVAGVLGMHGGGAA